MQAIETVQRTEASFQVTGRQRSRSHRGNPIRSLIYMGWLLSLVNGLSNLHGLAAVWNATEKKQRTCTRLPLRTDRSKERISCASQRVFTRRSRVISRHLIRAQRLTGSSSVPGMEAVSTLKQTIPRLWIN